MALAKKTQVRIARYAKRIGRVVVNIIGWSLRLDVQGWTRLQHLAEKGTPLVLQLWHGDMFIAWHVVAPLRPAAIVSQAGDGDIASAVLLSMNYKTFRGSSTRGGKKAYWGMIKYLRQQPVKIAAFASDGPQGPRRVLKAGTYVAAQHLKGYIIPTAVAARWSLHARSWDRFMIPLPFSRAVVRFGDPIKVDPDLKGEDMEKALNVASEICREHQESLENSL